MGHFVGVQEAQEQIASRGFVAAAHLDAAIQVTDPGSAGLLEGVEVECIERLAFVEPLRDSRVVVRPARFSTLP